MKFFNIIISLLFFELIAFNANAQFNEPPIKTVQRIGDKLIRETPFRYNLILAANNDKFNEMKFVDFGRTFGTEKKAVAYAFTQIHSEIDTIVTIEIEHNDACQIWCNGAIVYNKLGEKDIQLQFGERSIEMSFSFQVPLKKGENELLIKSETAGNGKAWSIFIQLPSENDAVLTNSIQYPSIGLSGMQDVDKKIAELTNWLVIGPFAPGINKINEPEKGVKFGTMYQGLNQMITWTIPKIEVLGDVIDRKAWGTTYQWNYHNGGVAWAMQQLAEVSGETKYSQWADNFCDYQIEGIPFVEYQVKGLHIERTANYGILNIPLLDFTLAPSLPFIYRLRKESNFQNHSKYENFIKWMMNYARFEQIRSEGYTNYTRTTPEKYTVWVDDMFMGIPFLMQAGLYDENLKNVFFDDAAQQVLDFNKHIWDKDAQLYMHANFSSRPDVKLPHWSRANGWAIWAMSEVLTYLPKNHPKYKQILKQFQVHANSLAKFQNKNGFWHNVIDYPQSPEEVSGTAIFTMAMARGVINGWLNAKKFKPVVLDGWKAVSSEIENDGTVHKICVGTMCSEDVNYYINRPFYDDDTHGSFAVLFAGIEVQRMLNKK